MRRIKPYVLGILLAWAMVIMAACGSKDSGNDSGASSEGAMTQTTQEESSSSGTTQSGGGKSSSASSDEEEESTGVIDGMMNDVRDTIDEGVGEAESGAMEEESSSDSSR